MWDYDDPLQGCAGYRGEQQDIALSGAFRTNPQFRVDAGSGRIALVLQWDLPEGEAPPVGAGLFVFSARGARVDKRSLAINESATFNNNRCHVLAFRLPERPADAAPLTVAAVTYKPGFAAKFM